MIAALLAAVLTLAAQDAAPGASVPDAAALLAEFDALQAECSSYSSEFWKSLQLAVDGTLQITDEQAAKLLDKVYGPRFLELGRRAGHTEAGAKALTEALHMVHDPPETRDEIIELLVRDFSDSPAMARAVPQIGGLRWWKGSAAAEALLRRVLDATHNEDVKAAATLELAQVLMEPVYPASGETAGESTPRSNIDPARQLLREVMQRWPDSTWAAEAKGVLFEAEHLQVGMVAPDFESTDQDGVKFKLSDYRGKVVLLDFWGFW